MSQGKMRYRFEENPSPVACEGTGGADEGTGGVWGRLAPGPLHSATEKFL